MVTEFRNEPLTDFSREENRAAFQKAIEQVRSRLGETLPLVIGGERIVTEDKIRSLNPSNPSEVVGLASKAPRGHVDRAIRTAHEAFDRWKAVSAEDRAEILFKAARLMRERRHILSATMVIECGKSWVEADADTAEAIDFLEFYGREVLRYARPPKLTPVPGETNRLEYLPLGAGVVIAPWNFPNAIFCGMTSAAFVAGNTVVTKPASHAVATGYRVFEILEEAGAPPGTINFLTGPGSEVGDALVDHPLTRFIAFTGSKEVGIRIYERAARIREGQKWLKRVIAEMGGKDAIIVDGDSDLEEAVRGVLVSAFGYQGQKCSACSRAIVTGDVYTEFVNRLRDGVSRITIGDPADPNNTLGPVIDESQYRKILGYIEIGKKEGRLVTGGEPVGGRAGYFIQPTVFADVDPRARIAQEEIFGPVLAVLKAKDFDEALRVANDTEYGLTGSVYTRDRAKIERAAREFHVGNLYFNRKCTGALVGGHPFGGFNMSGTDSKAGGYDYLLLFLQAKTISEKVG